MDIEFGLRPLGRMIRWVQIICIVSIVTLGTPQSPHTGGRRKWDRHGSRRQLGRLARSIRGDERMARGSIHAEGHAANRLTFQSNVAGRHFQTTPAWMTWYSTTSRSRVHEATH